MWFACTACDISMLDVTHTFGNMAAVYLLLEFAFRILRDARAAPPTFFQCAFLDDTTVLYICCYCCCLCLDGAFLGMP